MSLNFHHVTEFQPHPFPATRNPERTVAYRLFLPILTEPLFFNRVGFSQRAINDSELGEVSLRKSEFFP
jgi:hypothetical protein